MFSIDKKVGAAQKFAEELEKRQREEAVNKLQSHARMKNSQRRVSEQFPDSEFVRNRTPQRLREENNKSDVSSSNHNNDNNNTSDDNTNNTTDDDIIAQEMKAQMIHEKSKQNQAAAEENDDDDLIRDATQKEALDIATRIEMEEKLSFDKISELAAKDLAFELDQKVCYSYEHIMFCCCYEHIYSAAALSLRTYTLPSLFLSIYI